MPQRSFPILLVDDDPLIAEVLSRASQVSFPEASFIYVSSFEDAKTYIDDLEGKGPKIVLLDINLQDKVDGLDFLALLRAHPKGRLLPVIMLSATITTKLVERSYAFGASSFTVKPFNYGDWKTYLVNLRTYWFETVTLLEVSHRREN